MSNRQISRNHIMSDYFEEMGWQPVEADQIQRHQTLLVARFLMENGIFGDDFDAQSLAPPASKRLVHELPEKRATADDERCSICLKPNGGEDGADAAAGGDEDGDNNVDVDDPQMLFKVLPCTHAFHKRCVLPWLEKTNSCPLCRYEMATDDAGYEERKRQRQRQAQRDAELETLHDSMFG